MTMVGRSQKRKMTDQDKNRTVYRTENKSGQGRNRGRAGPGTLAVQGRKLLGEGIEDLGKYHDEGG